MYLKRFYDWSAPEEKWTMNRIVCATCRGAGAILRDGEPRLCPDCSGGIIEKEIPPVAGVDVLKAGPKVKHFSTRFVKRGQAEGWLELGAEELMIVARNMTLVYEIVRKPGRYGNEKINYFDCRRLQ